PICAAPQRLRRHAALCLFLVVWRCLFPLGNIEDSCCDRSQHCAERYPVLGHGHRRICPYEGIYSRAVLALVSVWDVLSLVSLSWTQLEAPLAVAVEHGRSGTNGNQPL